MGFSDLRRFVPGSHYGILLIRLHAPKRRGLIRRIENPFRQEDVYEWAQCLVVATEGRLRVRRPAKLG